MSSPDPRFEALASELRAAKPAASPGLRERVAELAEAPARPRRMFPRISARRAAVVLVPACLVAAVGAALIHGVVTSGAKRTAREFSGPPAGKALGQLRGKVHVPASPDENRFQADLAPSRRLQRYDVQLRLRVRNLDALSAATKRAMTETHRYGGYVASVTYATPTAKRGGADLVLMVPIDRVQDALQRLSGLGTILAQHVSIQDLQRQVNEESSTIGRLVKQIARIKSTLAKGGLSSEQRTTLEQRLAVDQRRLKTLQG